MSPSKRPSEREESTRKEAKKRKITVTPSQAPPTSTTVEQWLHRPLFDIVDKDYAVGAFDSKRGGRPQDVDFFQHGFKLLNGFDLENVPEHCTLSDWHLAQLLARGEPSLGKKWEADFVVNGTIRATRKHRGRAAKTLSRKRWYYQRVAGHLVVGDEFKGLPQGV